MWPLARTGPRENFKIGKAGKALKKQLSIHTRYKSLPAKQPSAQLTGPVSCSLKDLPFTDCWPIHLICHRLHACEGSWVQGCQASRHLRSLRHPHTRMTEKLAIWSWQPSGSIPGSGAGASPESGAGLVGPRRIDLEIRGVCGQPWVIEGDGNDPSAQNDNNNGSNNNPHNNTNLKMDTIYWALTLCLALF